MKTGRGKEFIYDRAVLSKAKLNHVRIIVFFHGRQMTKKMHNAMERHKIVAC